MANGPGDYNDYKNTPNLLNTVNPTIADTVVSFPTNYPNLRSTSNYSTISQANYNKPCGWSVIRFVASNPVSKREKRENKSCK